MRRAAARHCACMRRACGLQSTCRAPVGGVLLSQAPGRAVHCASRATSWGNPPPGNLVLCKSVGRSVTWIVFSPHANFSLGGGPSDGPHGPPARQHLQVQLPPPVLPVTVLG